MRHCLECNHVFTASDSAPEYLCPNCGAMNTNHEAAADTDPLQARASHGGESPRTHGGGLMKVVIAVVSVLIVASSLQQQGARRALEQQRQAPTEATPAPAYR